MTQATHRVTVPGLFWADHCARECLPAISESAKGNRVELVLDQEAFDDLLSDADYYSNPEGFDADWLRDGGRKVCASAARTLIALRTYLAEREAGGGSSSAKRAAFPKDPPHMTAKRVVAIRTEANLTQLELAAVLRMSDRRTVRRWEKGQIPVTGPASILLEMMASGELPKRYRKAVADIPYPRPT